MCTTDAHSATNNLPIRFTLNINYIIVQKSASSFLYIILSKFISIEFKRTSISKNQMEIYEFT